MKYIFPLVSVIFVFGCKTPSPTAAGNSDNSASTSETSAEIKNMQDRGIDFTAVGSIPVNWHMEMNFDDTVRFTADDGISLRFAYHKLKRTINAESTTYNSQINGGDISILVEKKDCTVPTVRQSFNKAVTITYLSKTYTGCGNYVSNAALNGKWLLEKIGTTAIVPGEYNKVPVFQFDLSTGKLTGNDGCNTIGGNIEVQGNRLQFSPLFSTKMACVKKSIDAIIGSKVSGKLVSWYFRDEKLYLYLEDDSLLVFKKG